MVSVVVQRREGGREAGRQNDRQMDREVVKQRERWTIIERGTAQKETDRQAETKRDRVGAGMMMIL